MACLARLVNVIAPIMTEAGGRASRQATYLPFHNPSRNGSGISMGIRIETPSRECRDFCEVPYLDA